jgi:hypothetical protein
MMSPGVNTRSIQQSPDEQRVHQSGAILIHRRSLRNENALTFDYDIYRYRREVLGTDESKATAHLHRVWKPNAVWVASIDRA